MTQTENSTIEWEVGMSCFHEARKMKITEIYNRDITDSFTFYSVETKYISTLTRNPIPINKRTKSITKITNHCLKMIEKCSNNINSSEINGHIFDLCEEAYNSKDNQEQSEILYKMHCFTTNVVAKVKDAVVDGIKLF